MNASASAVPAAVMIVMAAVASGCEAERKSEPPMKETQTTVTNPAGSSTKSDADWRKELTPDQYHVLRQAGTERPFGPAYEEFNRQGPGLYSCAGCGAELFSSREKFDSHCGWPSFYDPSNAKNVVTREDVTMGMVRVEVLCAKCGGHLGHVFKGEGFKTPTDLRYCINGIALKFTPGPIAPGEADIPAKR